MFGYLFSCVCVPTAMEVTEAEQRRRVEEQVEMLLSGQGSEVCACDVGLEQSKPATLRKTVTYIVCAVIFNDKVPRPDNFLFLRRNESKIKSYSSNRSS